jgi:DNA-binding beta-propeller fold protein YncE
VITRAAIVGLVAVAITAAGCGGGGGHSGQGTSGAGGSGGPGSVVAGAAQTCSTAVARQQPLTGATNHFISTAPDPFGAATASDGRFGFVTSSRPAIEVISGLPAEPRIARTVNLSTATQPSGLALTPDGRYLLAANTDGALVFSVARLQDGASHALLGTLSPPPGPRLQAGGAIEVASSRDSRYAFVSLEGAGRIAVYRLAAAIADRFRAPQLIGTIPTGVAPVGLAVSPDGRWLYATSEIGGPGSRRPRGRDDGTVTAISIARAERDPGRAAVASVYAGCAPVRVTTARDGSLVMVTARESDELLAYSAARLQGGGGGALLAAVRVGEAPVGLATVDGGTGVIVADSNRFNRPTARTGLTLINLAAMLQHRPSIVGELRAGAFPRDLAVTPDGRTVLVADFASSQMQVVGVPAQAALH